VPSYAIIDDVVGDLDTVHGHRSVKIADLGHLTPTGCGSWTVSRAARSAGSRRHDRENWSKST
jgi:hypothetical protein